MLIKPTYKIRGIARRNRVKKKCIVCGKEFEVIKSRENNAKFCSKKCMGVFTAKQNWKTGKFSVNKLIGRKYNKKKKGFYRKCLICGKLMYITPSHINRKYCSRKCQGIGNWKFHRETYIKNIYKRYKDKNPRWKGGRSWGYATEQAKQVLNNKIDVQVCQVCGSKDKTRIHHINFNHYDNRLENLCVLCVNCHAKIHSILYKEIIKLKEVQEFLNKLNLEDIKRKLKNN